MEESEVNKRNELKQELEKLAEDTILKIGKFPFDDLYVFLNKKYNDGEVLLEECRFKEVAFLKKWF